MARDRALIFNGTPCDSNFYENGPMRPEDRIIREPCFYHQRCPLDETGISRNNCLMRVGHQVAKSAIIYGVSVASVVNDRLVPRERSFWQRGSRYVLWSPNGEHDSFGVYEIDRDRRTIFEKVRDAAVLVLEGSNDDPTAAYRVPSQASLPSPSKELVLIHRPDGKTEIGFLTD